jgi:hypothetical protein
LEELSLKLIVNERLEKDKTMMIGSLELFEVSEDEEAIEVQKRIDVGLLIALIP